MASAVLQEADTSSYHRFQDQQQGNVASWESLVITAKETMAAGVRCKAC